MAFLLGAIEELLLDAQGEDPDGLDIFVGLNQLDDDDVPFLIADMEAERRRRPA